MSVPDLAEPIVAYRYVSPFNNFISGDMGPQVIFRTERKGGAYVYVSSLVPIYPVDWKEGVVTARCHFCDPAPGKDCPHSLGDGCGIYAYKFPTTQTNVQVQLWGQVMEYEFGYRAQHAQVVGFVSAAGIPYRSVHLKDAFGDLPHTHYTGEELYRQFPLYSKWAIDQRIQMRT